MCGSDWFSEHAAILSQRLAQFVNFVGLLQNLEAQRRFAQRVAVACRQQDRESRVFSAMVCASVMAVHLARHDDIAENQIDALPGDLGLTTASALENRSARVGQLSSSPALAGPHQDYPPPEGWCRCRKPRGEAFVRYNFHLVARSEIVTVVPYPVTADGCQTAGLIGKAVHLEKPKAGTLADRLGRKGTVEHFLHNVGGMAGACIRNANDHEAPLFASSSSLTFSALTLIVPPSGMASAR